MAASIDLVELLEDRLDLIGRNADSRVRHFDLERSTAGDRPEPHGSPVGIAYGVRDEVAEQAAQQRDIGSHALAAALEHELESLLVGLRLEVRDETLEHVVDAAVDELRYDCAAVELADVEHGGEQVGHRIERSLLLVDDHFQPRVADHFAARHAVQQVQGLERLAKIVARRCQETAFLPIRLKELMLRILVQRGVANRGDDQQLAGIGTHRAQADLDGKLVSVLVQPIQPEPGAHRLGLGSSGERFAMHEMDVPESRRQKDLDERLV
ncbi:MAG TPA: hypothetical protein VF329_05480 [Gammaproteobacteria bacterium]